MFVGLSLTHSKTAAMILITGATGSLGGNVIKHLLNKGEKAEHVAALTRDSEGALGLPDTGVEGRVADYTDYESLVRAFRGVDKLLLISSNDKKIENRTAHHLSAVKAAREAGVQHMVYTSFVRNPVAHSAIAAFQESHVRTERAIKDSGLDYTILQNGIYLEMIPIFAGEKVAETGIIRLPAQEGKASWVLREELAEAAAHVLTTKGHANQTYTLTNVESTSFGNIAQELSSVLGKDVAYQSPTVEEFRATLEEVDVPDLYVGLFTTWATAQAQGELDVKDDTLMSFLGRKPTTTRQFIQQVYG